MQASKDQISEDQVSAYLRENPQFFERNPVLLSEMYLPSPHGGGTISLAERQQLAQRDRIRVLEVKLSELLHFGEENDAISDKVHNLCLGIIATNDFRALTQLVIQNLREDFQVPHAAIRLWAAPKDGGNAISKEFKEVDAEVKSWAQGLVTPYCGHHHRLELNGWFDELVAPKSFALIALRSEQAFGLLALASDDEQRFYPAMGTLYLKRIGEMLSAALQGHLQ
jgi:uncharacterized protein YigA (DUF484 family)